MYKLSSYIFEKFKITKKTKAISIDPNKDYYIITFLSKCADLSDKNIIYQSTDKSNREVAYIYSKEELLKKYKSRELFDFYVFKLEDKYKDRLYELEEGTLDLETIRNGARLITISKIPKS